MTTSSGLTNATRKSRFARPSWAKDADLLNSSQTSETLDGLFSRSSRTFQEMLEDDHIELELDNNDKLTPSPDSKRSARSTSKFKRKRNESTSNPITDTPESTNSSCISQTSSKKKRSQKSTSSTYDKGVTSPTISSWISAQDTFFSEKDCGDNYDDDDSHSANAYVAGKVGGDIPDFEPSDSNLPYNMSSRVPEIPMKPYIRKSRPTSTSNTTLQNKLLIPLSGNSAKTKQPESYSCEQTLLSEESEFVDTRRLEKVVKAGNVVTYEQKRKGEHSIDHLRKHDESIYINYELVGDHDLGDESGEMCEIVASARRHSLRDTVDEASKACDNNASELDKQSEMYNPSSSGSNSTSPAFYCANSNDTIIDILVTSKIPNTRPLIVRRKLGQRLKEVREAWCKHQEFDEAFTRTVYLTYRNRKLFDLQNCSSLNLEEKLAKVHGGSLEKFEVTSRSTNEDRYVDTNLKVLLEAVTQSIHEANKLSAKRKLLNDITDEDEQDNLDAEKTYRIAKQYNRNNCDNDGLENYQLEELTSKPTGFKGSPNGLNGSNGQEVENFIDNSQFHIRGNNYNDHNSVKLDESSRSFARNTAGKTRCAKQSTNLQVDDVALRSLREKPVNSGDHPNQIRLVLQGKNFDDFKLVVKPETTFNSIIRAFRKRNNIAPESQVFLMFEGVRLLESDTMSSSDVQDMDTIDVHVRR